MVTDAVRHIVAGVVLIFAGCAMATKSANTIKATGTGHSDERRIVKTTAYTSSDSRRAASGAKSALGSELQSGEISSAAADWSRFPIGTKFRVVETSKTYVVDDYGPALVGTDTIDLYVPSRRIMNQWGVRRVTIQVVEKGSYAESLQVLESRRSNSCCRQMARNIQKQIANTY